MLKLYRIDDGKPVAYHEAWVQGSVVVEHWGRLGERGQTREHPLNRGFFKRVSVERILQTAINDGFRPIDVDDHAILLVEYRVEGMGTASDVEKRHALEDRMNELLGWTGLGHCDGGSIGSGTMEVCCFVVDFDTAKRVIEEDLFGTEFADYSRIYRENES